MNFNIVIFADFGDSESVTGGKQVFACHNFLDYSGEARNTNISINIEETMAILTRLVLGLVILKLNAH